MDHKEFVAEGKVQSGIGRLRSVARPRLFESPRVLRQPRIFALDALGKGGWLKALRLEGYAPGASRSSLSASRGSGLGLR